MSDSGKKIHYKSSRNTVLDNVFTGSCISENAKMKQQGTQIAEIYVEDYVSASIFCANYILLKKAFFMKSKRIRFSPKKQKKLIFTVF